MQSKQYSLGAFWVAKDAKYQSYFKQTIKTDQTALMRSLISDLSLHLVHMSEGMFSRCGLITFRYTMRDTAELPHHL